MEQHLIDQGIELMRVGRFGNALPLFRRAVEEDPSRWNAWYMAGQCCRFLNDIDGAISHLTRASQLKSDEPPIFLALGIALQLRERWDDAIEAFRRAIEIDPDYELAYNSLALTQKRAGELEKALSSYHAGVNALARRIVNGMQNRRSNPILKHRETVGVLWVEYAVYAALYLASSADGISHVSWVTPEQAMDEERTERHAGLYWTDVSDDRGEMVRLFLQNFFNTLQQSFRVDIAYSNLIGNRGTVLELLGQHDDARRHFEEAAELRP